MGAYTACTATEETVYVCFGSENKNGCLQSKDPVDNFMSHSKSLYDHMAIRISSTEG